jgi:hypothetical protein
MSFPGHSHTKLFVMYTLESGALKLLSGDSSGAKQEELQLKLHEVPSEYLIGTPPYISCW